MQEGKTQMHFIFRNMIEFTLHYLFSLQVLFNGLVHHCFLLFWLMRLYLIDFITKGDKSVIIAQATLAFTVRVWSMCLSVSCFILRFSALGVLVLLYFLSVSSLLNRNVSHLLLISLPACVCACLSVYIVQVFLSSLCCVHLSETLHVLFTICLFLDYVSHLHEFLLLIYLWIWTLCFLLDFCTFFLYYCLVGLFSVWTLYFYKLNTFSFLNYKTHSAMFVSTVGT